MTDGLREDLRAFHDFLGRQLADGSVALTPAEALELWEAENPEEEEERATLEAIREGLADGEAGRTRPARTVAEEVLRKFDASANP